ncbi:MAG: hypothetical protein P1P84_02515 [Deferrisomatales bacterium]|nr:hypothetical protein [Deferrisomatales bacterium]
MPNTVTIEYCEQCRWHEYDSRTKYETCGISGERLDIDTTAPRLIPDHCPRLED